MIFGDGWCEETQEPPEELPQEYAETVQHFGNGFWAALTHSERKRFEGREDRFLKDLGKLFCAYLRPLKAYQFPFNG
jgi:hypothetical protein